jgi:hypothetical protein
VEVQESKMFHVLSEVAIALECELQMKTGDKASIGEMVILQ